MLEIEVIEPDDIERAAKVFLRDGFVAIANAIQGDPLQRIQAAATRVIGEIVADDPEYVGNRGHHRYSFGNQMRNIEWCELTDLPTILPIVEAIWDSNDFVSCGNGAIFRYRVPKSSTCTPTATNWALPIPWGRRPSVTCRRH